MVAFTISIIIVVIVLGSNPIFRLTNIFPMSAVPFFYHIRQFRQIRPSLNLNSSIQLGNFNALVSSKLDYCNSLFYDLPDTSIKRLQRVQNSLARVIFPSPKRSDFKKNFTSFEFIRESNLKCYHHIQGLDK